MLSRSLIFGALVLAGVAAAVRLGAQRGGGGWIPARASHVHHSGSDHSSSSHSGSGGTSGHGGGSGDGSKPAHCDVAAICRKLAATQCERMCDVGGARDAKLVICGGSLPTCASAGHAAGSPCAAPCATVHAFIAEAAAAKNLAVELAGVAVSVKHSGFANKEASIKMYCEHHAKSGFKISESVAGHRGRKQPTCEGRELLVF
jgi:hypothetical protein